MAKRACIEFIKNGNEKDVKLFTLTDVRTDLTRSEVDAVTAVILSEKALDTDSYEITGVKSVTYRESVTEEIA